MPNTPVADDKYQTLFYSIDQGFHISELIYNENQQAIDWRFLEVNQIFDRQTGLQNVVGQLGSMVTPSVESYWLLAFDQVVQTGKPTRLEDYNKFTGRWYSAYVSRIGKVGSLQFAVVFDDITERKRHEASLAFLADVGQDLAGLTNIEATMNQLGAKIGRHFSASVCVFSDVNEEAGFIVAKHDWHRADVPSTKGTYRIADYHTEAFRTVSRAGKTYIVYNCMDDPRVNGPNMAAISVGAYVNVPFVRDGKWLFNITVIDIAPRNWHADEIDLMRELVNRIWTRLERARAEEALRVADQRKDEFLAMLAHELRNPLSTIRSGLQVLTLTGGNDETSRATIAMMDRQTDYLVRMVDDLLDVSRISRGKVELKTQRINLVELVAQAVQSVQALYQEQGRRLQVDLPTAPIYVEGDRARLSQVVTNLLTNGARYTEESGQVWLSLAQQDGQNIPSERRSVENRASPTLGGPWGEQQALIQVRDNGIGLAADQLVTIFELFVQVDTSLARSKGGLGLGLTLVKQLVEMHGGQVEAQSEGIGKGSTFRVYLPTLNTVPDPERRRKPAEGSLAGVSTLRLLVVDDNADAALTLSMFLKLKGYEVHTRHSGQAGIEAVESLNPAAILLDIGMPGLDGYQTCRFIRQQPWGQDVVVIAITGYGQEEDRQRTRAAGFDGHLVKPPDLTVLTKLLADLLDKSKAKS